MEVGQCGCRSEGVDMRYRAQLEEDAGEVAVRGRIADDQAGEVDPERGADARG